MPEDVEYTHPSDEYLRRRLQRMDPYDFEAFVADVWEYIGWDTRTVGEPGDRGIDVIATDDGAGGLFDRLRSLFE